jgi:fucose 4-O-acetylase-like acetyltransferase
MPVFLAISGYLLKTSAFKNGLRSYLDRLVHRLVIPWIIASIAYLPWSLHGRSLSEITLADFIYPYFHLWYVPAYIIGVSICYCINRFKIPIIPILVLSAVFTIIWFDVFRSNQLPLNHQPFFHLGEKRFYAYQIFFILGFSLRNNLIKLSPSLIPLVLCIIISFAINVILVYRNFGDYYISIPYMIFNISLVLFLLLYIAPLEWFQNKTILWANKQSLSIYLYHPMIVFTIYNWLGDPTKKHSTNLTGILVGSATLIIMLIAIWLIQKWSVSNRYLLGIINEKT